MGSLHQHGNGWLLRWTGLQGQQSLVQAVLGTRRPSTQLMFDDDEEEENKNTEARSTTPQKPQQQKQEAKHYCTRCKIIHNDSVTIRSLDLFNFIVPKRL